MSVSTKQRSCDSGLAAVPSPSSAASARTPALDSSPLVEAVEHVCLIASRVPRSVERHQRSSAAGAGVVTGHEVGRPRGTSPLEEHAELDALVASNARVRGDALRVAVLEIAHDVTLEVLLEIPDVVRQGEQGGDAPGVINGVDRATTTIPDGVAAASPHRERDPEGVKPGSRNARGGDAGVHSTRHRHCDHR